jgi:hypothetical protein
MAPTVWAGILTVSVAQGVHVVAVVTVTVTVEMTEASNFCGWATPVVDEGS